MKRSDHHNQGTNVIMFNLCKCEEQSLTSENSTEIVEIGFG